MLGQSVSNVLNFKVFLAFFLPLIFMTELHQITHSIVHAFLARLNDPKETLAAFSIAYALNSTLVGINLVALQGGISFIKDKPSFWKLCKFFGTICIVLFIIIEFIALSSFSERIFGKFIGASGSVVQQANTTLAIMGFWFFPTFTRSLMYGLLMVHHRTICITVATSLRIASLALFLIILPIWFKGAAVGATGIVLAMTVEAFYMLFVGKPYLKSLSKKPKSNPSLREIWRFSWPLMFMQSSENGVVLVLTFFLGRLKDTDLALAGFGVIYALFRTILASERNLIHAAQALITSSQHIKTMFKYGTYTIAFFVIVVIILFSNFINNFIFENVMGLRNELHLYVIPGSKLIFFVAIFWGYAALLRGMLSAMRHTGSIAISALIRLIMLAIIGSSSFFWPQSNGTVIGVLSIGGSFAAETVFLCLCLYRQLKTSHSLFAHLEETS